MVTYYHSKILARFMSTFIGYILLMTLMFSLAAGLYFGLKTVRLI